MMPIPGEAKAIRTLNQAITAYTGRRSTDPSRLLVADLANRFDTAQHPAPDGMHPTASGAKRMAEKLAGAMDPCLGD